MLSRMVKPKLICFDFDDTLTTENSWLTLNTALGITPAEDQKMYEAFKTGELSYLDWTDKISSYYRIHGLANKDTIEHVLHTIPLKPDAKAVITELHVRGYITAIISGSFTSLVSQHASELGITHVYAGTKIKYDGENNFIELQSEGEESGVKVKHLTDLCSKLGIQVTDCACIGDGANDIELFRVTGRGICFSDASDYVKSEAVTSIDTLSDLLEIFE